VVSEMVHLLTVNAAVAVECVNIGTSFLVPLAAVPVALINLTFSIVIAPAPTIMVLILKSILNGPVVSE